MQKSVGSIVVTETGNVVLLTETDSIVQDGQCSVGVFDKGIILRGTSSVGSPCMIRSGDGLRVVSHVAEILRLLEEIGVDLSAPAERHEINHVDQCSL